MGEFDLIERYFKVAQASNASVALGIGDDCALLQSRPGTQMAISSDMLVEGRHFLSTVSPQALGHKALAVNLSDLAACGATPIGFTLALALPRVDEAWLAGFSHGLLQLAAAHQCVLVGGDTTQGPLNICITVFGEVPLVNGKSQALLRSGAQVGDDIYVSGSLGDARLALEVFRGNLQVDESIFSHCRQRMERPTPRIAMGSALRGVASAAIDVSDGLLGDLGHILKASRVGACIDIPVAMNLVAACAYSAWLKANIPPEKQLDLVLCGGDDYELVFTAAPAVRAAVQAASQNTATPVTRIGQIEAETGQRLRDAHGQVCAAQFSSFDHFA